MNWIIGLGILFIAVGTILTYVGSDIKNRETTKTLETSINAKDNRIEELIAGKNTLIDQNKTLSNQIESYQKDLESKQKKIDKLEILSKKDIYKPLSPELKKQIIARLSSLEGIVQIEISTFDTNNNGRQVVNDLFALLKELGIASKSDKNGMSFGRGVRKPRMIMNQKTVPIAEKFAEALSPYLRMQYTGKVDDSLGDGVINIEFHGVPLFHQDGSIEFQ